MDNIFHKGCDAFQLSSAIAINADILISLDNELTKAAEQSNLTVWDPSKGNWESN